MSDEAQLKATIGELSQQLQEAVAARTNMGVSWRLAQERIAALEAEIEALKSRKRPKRATRQDGS